jgi:hypothetical protein
MNKIILTVSMLTSMLSPNEIKRDGTEVYHGTQLIWAMDNLKDMQEYVYEDMVNGKIDEETAENYNELLGETQSFIQDFYEKQCR